MSTPHNPPGPNSRHSKGFLVTVALPMTVLASRLQRHDVFVLPEQGDQPLAVADVTQHPHLEARLVIELKGTSIPITLHVNEPVQPVSMPRRVDVKCQLCGNTTTTDIDLVAHGEPKTWVCNRH
ncbi:hypothetical protein [Streptomyces roseochromogenus]|uniref:Uncharacterized protein n=1 Tax=Streptomyces roseochromogenus subsp. oscitans DS 12.976 TaxID=1352936 RepID=V6KED2_STRRC|nr:hypothetical protein [Streptomyces roseochromogenus]EST27344.1 hypothetical protein M878_25435 [Streptomyces roseochromogenus subsp. oscitans DS 12.976]